MLHVPKAGETLYRLKEERPARHVQPPVDLPLKESASEP
jgi:hypothetical protein